MAGRLLQRGLQGSRQVVGRRQDFGVTTYRLRFTTLAGQQVEDYSSGWRVLPGPGYPDGAWVSLRYLEAQPARYMPASELSLANLLAMVGLLIGVLLLALAWLTTR